MSAIRGLCAPLKSLDDPSPRSLSYYFLDGLKNAGGMPPARVTDEEMKELVADLESLRRSSDSSRPCGKLKGYAPAVDTSSGPLEKQESM